LYLTARRCYGLFWRRGATIVLIANAGNSKVDGAPQDLRDTGKSPTPG
jgi:hypothetical protein